jgi:hypothetical protein
MCLDREDNQPRINRPVSAERLLSTDALHYVSGLIMICFGRTPISTMLHVSWMSEPSNTPT